MSQSLTAEAISSAASMPTDGWMPWSTPRPVPGSRHACRSRWPPVWVSSPRSDHEYRPLVPRCGRLVLNVDCGRLIVNLYEYSPAPFGTSTNDHPLRRNRHSVRTPAGRTPSRLPGHTLPEQAGKAHLHDHAILRRTWRARTTGARTDRARHHRTVPDPDRHVAR